MAKRKEKKGSKRTNGKVLITGGAGYIGCVLVEELLAKGYALRVLDTFYWGFEPLKHVEDKVEFVQKDIREVGEDAFKDVFAVIHLAGLSNDPMAEFNPKANYDINTKATKRIAVLCKTNGIRRFTFASSASVYDRGLLAEDLLLDEDAKVSPRAAYSSSKYRAENELLKLSDKDFCPVIMRQGTVYGFSPRMRYDLVVNTMVKSAILTNKINVFCGGEQWRPLIDIHDVALAHVAAIEASLHKVGGKIYNLVYKNYRMLDLAHRIRKVLRDELNINPEIEVDYFQRKDRNYRISGEKIKRILGWEPKISVEESVGHMLKEIKNRSTDDFMHPRYYNIEWMKILKSTSDLLENMKRVF